MEQAQRPQYPGPSTEQRPLSKLAIWSMVLGIVFLCLGPLGLIPLIMGIIAIPRTSANGTRSGMGFAIAGTSLGAVAVLGTCLSIGIFLPALGKARQRAQIIVSQTQMSMQMQAIEQFAMNNDGQYPTAADWPDALIDGGYLEADVFVSPMEDTDEISYIYLANGNPNDPNRILIYEDPNHFEFNVLVGFADGTVREIPKDQLEQLLELQTTNEQP